MQTSIPVIQDIAVKAKWPCYISIVHTTMEIFKLNRFTQCGRELETRLRYKVLCEDTLPFSVALRCAMVKFVAFLDSRLKSWVKSSLVFFLLK